MVGGSIADVKTLAFPLERSQAHSFETDGRILLYADGPKEVMRPMTKTSLSLAVLLLLALPVPSWSADPPAATTVTASVTLDSLAWLAGSWSGTTDKIFSEEHWMAPRGNTMVGMHRDLRDGRTLIFEFMRIEATPEGIVFMAQPKGRPATPFPMVEMGPRRVVFANPKHDYPQRIIYALAREGVLQARVEGERNGKLWFEEWSWPPATLGP